MTQDYTDPEREAEVISETIRFLHQEADRRRAWLQAEIDREKQDAARMDAQTRIVCNRTFVHRIREELLIFESLPGARGTSSSVTAD